MEAKDYVHAIRARGLTQAQIFEKTGIPQPTISKIERGEVADVMSRSYRALQALYESLYKPENEADIAQPAIKPVADKAQSAAIDLEKSDQERRDQERRDAERRERERRGATESTEGV